MKHKMWKVPYIFSGNDASLSVVINQFTPLHERRSWRVKRGNYFNPSHFLFIVIFDQGKLAAAKQSEK